MLLTAISYESTFGAIAPYLIKVGLACLSGIVIVVLISRAARRFSRSLVR
jgi:hypothetical protein